MGMLCDGELGVEGAGERGGADDPRAGAATGPNQLCHVGLIMISTCSWTLWQSPARVVGLRVLCIGRKRAHTTSPLPCGRVKKKNLSALRAREGCALHGMVGWLVGWLAHWKICVGRPEFSPAAAFAHLRVLRLTDRCRTLHRPCGRPLPHRYRFKQLVAMLKGSDSEHGAEAALALASVTGCNQGADQAMEAGALLPLVALVEDPAADAEGRRNAARALGHVARSSEAARKRLDGAGATIALAKALMDTELDTYARAAAAEALDNLARGTQPHGDERRMQAIADTGCLPALVALLGAPDRHSREVAAAATYALAYSETPRRNSLREAGAPDALKAAAAQGGSAAWWASQSLARIDAEAAAQAA